MSHGGDRYSHKIELDFSVNLNPLGIPDRVRNSLLESCTMADRYPDLQCRQLRQALADVFGLQPANVLPGNGASELLMAAVHAIRPEKAVLPVPSFSGYLHVLKAAGCRIGYEETREENGYSPDEGLLSKLTPDTDLVILANPGNPAGRYIDAVLLDKILERCRDREIPVLLDECFMEMSDDPAGRSQTGKLGQWPNLLVLRAFTKSFAVPGIRLGYLLSADTEMLERIAEQLPEWNVSLQAQAAGCAALEERPWLEEARRMIRTERHYLENELREMGFVTIASDAGYLLFRDRENRKGNLYTELLAKGILIRDCSDYRGIRPFTYRIAVKKPEENRLLVRKIRECLAERQAAGVEGRERLQTRKNP